MMRKRGGRARRSVRIIAYALIFAAAQCVLSFPGMPPKNSLYALRADEEKANVNFISALEFELKTSLYERGRQFEALRAILGEFEDMEQLILLMKIPETIASNMRARLVCFPGLSGALESSLESSDEDEIGQERVELDLANLERGALEELPFITPTLALRLARASREGRLQERWQLLAVPGITPEIYVAVKKYFSLHGHAKKENTKSIYKHDIGFIANADSWSLRNTVQLSGDITAGLRTIHDNKRSLASPQGWFASGDAFPALAQHAGFYAQAGNDSFSFLAGTYRVRSPLGLLAGRASFGSGALTFPGAKSAAVIPQLSDSARDVLTGAAFSFSLPWIDVTTFFSARSFFASEDKFNGNRYQGTLRSLIYKQDNLRESDTARVNEIIFGSLAEFHIQNNFSASLGGVFPSYSCAFDPDPKEPALTGDRRRHGMASFAWDAGEFGVFGEGAIAGDAGYGGTGKIKARAAELGLKGKRSRLRYSLSFQESTKILPGLHDGLAGLGGAGRNILLQNEWLIFDSLRWQYAFNLYPEVRSDAKTRFSTALRWKASGMFEVTLSARLLHEKNELENELRSAQYRCTLLWSSGTFFSLKLDAGTRFEKSSGTWLTSALAFPLAAIRCTLAYGIWQADPRMQLWPSFPLLISAGENTLSAYTGRGRMAVLKSDIPIKKDTMYCAFKVALKEYLKIDSPSMIRDASVAASLEYRL